MKIQIVAIEVVLGLALCSGVAAGRAPQAASPLPAGTAVPVTFSHALDAAKLKVGDPVIVKTNQVILASGGQRIPSGSQLTGSIVEVQSSGASTDPSELSIRFDTLRVGDQVIPVHVALRALASFVDSYSAHSPAVDNGYSDNSVYRQVGGDYFYQGDVVYSNDWEEVGKSTHDAYL